MERMKTFFIYALIIVLFYFFSNFAINLLIANSYKELNNHIEIEQSDNGFSIIVDTANSNKQQGYFIGKVKNTSDQVIAKQYVKVDSYYKGKIMQSKYLAFENLQPGEERTFKLVFSVGNIDEYKVSYVDEIPINRTKLDDAIDAIKGFLGNVVDGIENFSFTETANSVGGAFRTVTVEGEDWQLLIAVLLVGRAIAFAFMI